MTPSFLPFPQRALSLLASGLLMAALVLAGCDGGGANGDGDDGEPSIDPPSAPSGLSLSQVDNTTVGVSWSANSGTVDGYNVYRDTSPISDVGSLSPLNSSTLSGTSYDDGSVDNTTTYYYRVTAVNEGGESDASGEQQITTPYPTPPDRP